MRGGYPSQTLPFAGGQPPTPPGSVSPLHHDQRPALDPLIHRAGIHKTSSQTSPPRRRPGPTRRPNAVPCTKPLVPGHNYRRKLQAQTIAAAIQKAQGQPRRRQTRAALHGSFLTRSGPPLTVREHQHQPDQHTPRRRQAFEGHRLGRLHGLFLTRSAPQPTTARPSRPARDRPSTCTTTGRPCASPSPSLRSTSASAWAALSTQPTKQRLPHRPSPFRSVAAHAPAGLIPAA